MSENKNDKPEEKKPEADQTEKEKKIPASARKPGQNYSTTKFKK